MRSLIRALVAFVGLAGCEVDPTEIVVVVHSDLAVPSELDGIRVYVDGPVHEVDAGTYDVAVGELPVTFGVAPANGKASSKVMVEVTARHADAEPFRTWARTTFIEHRVLQLDLWLARRCIVEAAGCGPEQTCGRDGCQNPDVDPRTLPDFDGQPAPDTPDGGSAVPTLGARIVGWADAAEGSQTYVVGAVAAPAGRTYWVGQMIGAGSVGGHPVTEGGFLACIEPDGTACWAPRALTADAGSRVTMAGVTLDAAGRVVVAFEAWGHVAVGTGSPDSQAVDSDYDTVALARFSAATGVLDGEVHALDSGRGLIFFIGLASGAAGLAVAGTCDQSVDGHPCPGAAFVAPLDDDLAARCLAGTSATMAAGGVLAAYGEQLALGGVLLTAGPLGATGYPPVSPDLAWIVAYDANCQTTWDEARSLAGLVAFSFLSSAGAEGDELLVMGDAAGGGVDDGAAPLSDTPGVHSFTERLDARGHRLGAAFLDTPVAHLGRVLASPLPAGRAAIEGDYTVLGVEGDTFEIAWQYPLPFSVTPRALTTARNGDLVQLMGNLSTGENTTFPGEEEIVADPSQRSPAFLWTFDPPD